MISSTSGKALAFAMMMAVVVTPLPAEEQPAALPVPSPKVSAPADPVDALDAGQLQEAIDILRRDHVRGPQIDEIGLSRATLTGLLERLAPGASLVTEAPAQPADSPFRSEILDGRAGYLRLGSLNSENIAQLDAALRDFAGKNLHGVVLDLRATSASSDFALAAEVAGRFCPAGAALFTLSAPAKKMIAHSPRRASPFTAVRSWLLLTKIRRKQARHLRPRCDGMPKRCLSARARADAVWSFPR